MLELVLFNRNLLKCGTLIFKYSYLRLLISKSVSNKRIIQQGVCKNMFFNSQLPDDEITVIRPPIGNSDFQGDEYWILKKTLYGLWLSPHHW